MKNGVGLAPGNKATPSSLWAWVCTMFYMQCACWVLSRIAIDLTWYTNMIPYDTAPPPPNKQKKKIQHNIKTIKFNFV